MDKLSPEDLGSKAVDLAISQTELRPYFLLDEQESLPFRPAIRVDPRSVEIPEPLLARRWSGNLARLAVWGERLKRDVVFQQRLKGGYDGPIIVAEGDSWFQYPVRVVDVIDHLTRDFAVRSLDWPGATLQGMLDEREYLPALRETNASAFLLSGGGNDVLGSLNIYLSRFDPRVDASEHILPTYWGMLEGLMQIFSKLFREILEVNENITIFCHGYDRPVPNAGRWLGIPMQDLGIEEPGFQKKITDRMVDEFNDRLKVVAAGFTQVVFIDLRGVVGGASKRWEDELHPTSAAFGDVAGRFKEAIERSVA